MNATIISLYKLENVRDKISLDQNKLLFEKILNILWYTYYSK